MKTHQVQKTVTTTTTKLFHVEAESEQDAIQRVETGPAAELTEVEAQASSSTTITAQPL